MSGLLSGLLLRRAGWVVDVYERVESELSGRGAGIVAQAELIERLRALGLPTAELGVQITTRKILDARGHFTHSCRCPQVLTAWERVYRLLRDAFPPANYHRGRGLARFTQDASKVTAHFSDGESIAADLLVGADGIRSKVRGMIGIEDQPKPVGMGIWRTVAKRPAEMDCSELYFGGPKYKADYTPISEDLCYAFLLEENLDRSYVGEGARGAELKERGQGYGGIWGQVRDSLADDAIVNYQWIEAICVESPWYRGRTIIIGDAAHACPPLIAQGAAMCAEDAVILAEMLTSGSSVDEVLPAFMERRFPRVKMVLDNSLTLAEWEIHPETPGADPGRIMGQTLGALVAPA